LTGDFDVRAYDLTTPTAATQHSEPSGSFSSQVLSVKKEVYDFMNATNRPNDTSLDYLQGKYREQVNYFGKMRSKADVLKDKSAFFRKWPIRNYSIQSSSVAVTCENSSECKAEGIVDWNVYANSGVIRGIPVDSVSRRDISLPSSAGDSLRKHHARRGRGSYDLFPLRMKNSA
jgi:hypothetical protein